MWGDFARLAPAFGSAVLTTIDAEGYPASTRVQFALDTDQERVRLEAGIGTPLRAGKAALLFHSFNDKLWDLRSYMLRGTLTQADGGWLFAPEQYTPGMSQDPRAFFTFVRTARRKAAAYLKKRNLPRPKIPWDDINRIKKQAGL